MNQEQLRLRAEMTECPTCKAKPNEPCIYQYEHSGIYAQAGTPMKKVFHKQRYELAKEIEARSK